MDDLDRAWHETRDEGVSILKLVTRASVSRLLRSARRDRGMDKGLKGSWGASSPTRRALCTRSTD
jgi:hypothetical protein